MTVSFGRFTCERFRPSREDPSARRGRERKKRRNRKKERDKDCGTHLVQKAGAELARGDFLLEIVVAERGPGLNAEGLVVPQSAPSAERVPAREDPHEVSHKEVPSLVPAHPRAVLRAQEAADGVHGEELDPPVVPDLVHREGPQRERSQVEDLGHVPVKGKGGAHAARQVRSLKVRANLLEVVLLRGEEGGGLDLVQAEVLESVRALGHEPALGEPLEDVRGGEVPRDLGGVSLPPRRYLRLDSLDGRVPAVAPGPRGRAPRPRSPAWPAPHASRGCLVVVGERDLGTTPPRRRRLPPPSHSSRVVPGANSRRRRRSRGPGRRPHRS